jgi:hypothetical protein
MEIIQAGPGQAYEIAQLNDAVQKMHADRYPNVFKYPTDSAEIMSFFSGTISEKDTFIFIATIAGRAVGYVWCEIQKRNENVFKYGQKRVYMLTTESQDSYRF